MSPLRYAAVAAIALALLLAAANIAPTPSQAQTMTDHPRTDNTDAKPDPLNPADPEGLVFRVTFDKSPLGPYADKTMRAEWPGTVWASLDRASIIEGEEAHTGRSLRIVYPKGAVGPQTGGAQWRIKLPKSYDELYCAYWIKFGEGFDFVKGGKIPGLCGGKGNTGGDKPTGKDGWSARMMWRKNGEAVQYLYHPDQPVKWGESLPWNLDGQRRFKPGAWHRVEHRIVMNTPGKKDGIIQTWWDGKLALDRRDIRFRLVDDFAIDIFYFSTFFGGNSPDWAPTRDEHVDFDDFIIATQPITH